MSLRRSDFDLPGKSRRGKIVSELGYLEHSLMEEVLAGSVDACVNEITSVDFQTTRLKEIRADARKRAVEAAREKAENYCAAAGVCLGRIIHIEDVNPDTLQSGEGHGMREITPEEDGEIQAFDPGSITVRAAVRLAFEIEQQSS